MKAQKDNSIPVKQKPCCRKASELVKALVALGFLYSLAMHAANKLYLVASGLYKSMSLMESATAEPIAWAGISIEISNPVVDVLLPCIIGGIITYVILQYICADEWVQEPVNVKKCWKEFKWTDLVSWIEVMVCTVVEVLKWVLKQICNYKEIIVSVLVVGCVIAGLVMIFA